MKERSRIVFIHPSDEMYGADRILLDLFGALSPDERERSEFWLPIDVPHGERVVCVELEAFGAVVRHVDVPILRRSYRKPRPLLRLLRRCFGTFRLLRAARPATVYLTTSATYLCAPLARLAGASSVIGHKQEMWSAGDVRVLGPCALACHKLIAISNPVKDNLSEALRDRTVVVLNSTPTPASYESLDDRAGSLTYTIASRWNAWKGHRTLLAAWDLVDRPGCLVVLGGDPPSGETVDVRSIVATLRHPDSVTIVGEVADISPYLEATDVVLVPSDEPEPFGLVAIEAFARGRPVVGTAAGGLADIIDDGNTGWTFPPGDVEALAGIFERLDRIAVNEAGAAARHAYEARYTAERFGVDWRAAVGRLLSPPDAHQTTA